MKRAVAGFVLLAAFSAFSSDSRGASGRTKWWDIRLHLTVNGWYTYDGPDHLLKGEFRYETSWTGSMERDGDDFILYHGRLETLGWELREKNESPESATPLTEQDICRKPDFQMVYLLREGNHLRIYFTVGGFQVPFQESLEKFDLILPSSKSDIQDPSDYPVSITKGTNDIVIDGKSFLNRPAEQTFRWTWKRYIPSEARGSTLTKAAAHDVEVAIKIAPHR